MHFKITSDLLKLDGRWKTQEYHSCQGDEIPWIFQCFLSTYHKMQEFKRGNRRVPSRDNSSKSKFQASGLFFS